MENNFEDRGPGSYTDYRQGGGRPPGRFGGHHRNWSAHQGMGFAILLMVVGVVLFLDNLGIYRIHDIWEYWPLFICLPGIQHFVNSKTWAGRIWGCLLVGGGVLWACENAGILHWPGGAIWSLFLIGVGFMLLVQVVESRGASTVPDVSIDGMFTDASLTAEDVIKDAVIFSGQKRRIVSRNFRGGEIVAIFGGVEMDLRRAVPNASQEMMIDAVAVFGGIVIRVPDTWRVVMRGTGVFGGYEDKTIPPPPAPGVVIPTMLITGSAVFGGVSIENV
jgi:hypothetical protein